ncbi:MAG: NCS1 family transporter [Tissierellia bacterium]|nr:NCS1 family transporter [Tissierellia bacterium]
MSEQKDKKLEKKEAGTLKPLKDEERSMSWFSYLMLWLGGCISIGTLTMGSAQIDKGLNLWQILLAVALGTGLLVLGIIMNDQFSYRTGSPYAIQLKSAFGTKGNIIPVMIRGLPAIVWYGFQTWLGGNAINNISIALFNYDNVWLYFIGFQALQIFLSVKGFHGIKWVENIGGVVIVLAMLYMLYISVTNYGDVISEELINIEPVWGLSFVGAIMAFFGNSTTVMLNAGDYSRELIKGHSNGKRATAYFLSMFPATVLLGLIGAMASVATGIANPINAFSHMVDSKVLLVITLLFIIFAQMTTNLASNVIPPAYAFMDAFKIKHKTSVIIVGILAIASAPWILANDSSAAGLDIFVKIYTAFFGPIFAILIVDYYFLHRKNITDAYLEELYKPNGIRSGFNKAALLALVIGAIIGLLNVEISFFTATIPTGLMYYYGTKHMKSAAAFRVGTKFDPNLKAN